MMLGKGLSHLIKQEQSDDVSLSPPENTMRKQSLERLRNFSQGHIKNNDDLRIQIQV